MTLNLYIPEERAETFAEWGERLGLKISAVNIPHRHDGDDSQWGDEAIHFSVTITQKNGAKIWSGNYTVGAAFPLMWAKHHYKGKAGPIAAALRDLKTFPGGHDSRTLYAEERRKIIRAAFMKAAPITLACVLESLHCDISGVDQPFNDWASDLGMDSDSRRAVAIYDACRKTRAALQSLPVADFEAFEMLEA